MMIQNIADLQHVRYYVNKTAQRSNYNIMTRIFYILLRITYLVTYESI